MWLIVIMVIVMFIVIAVHSSQEIDQRNETHSRIMNGRNDFSPTKELRSTSVDHAVYIDEKNKKVMFVVLSKDTRTTFNFDELIECSILEDGSTVQSGSAGRAIAGGIVAGGIGAVVGASAGKSKPITLSLSVRVVTTNIQNALYEIPIITYKTKRDSDTYKRKMQFAQEIYATLVSIMDLAKKEQANMTAVSISVPEPSPAPTVELPQSQREAIRNLTELRNAGILTEEEYAKKVTKVLDEESTA